MARYKGRRKKYAGRVAKKVARKVYRKAKRMPKRKLAKLYAAKCGKATFKRKMGRR